jgi:hypothetical protein
MKLSSSHRRCADLLFGRTWGRCDAVFGLALLSCLTFAGRATADITVDSVSRVNTAEVYTTDNNTVDLVQTPSSLQSNSGAFNQTVTGSLTGELATVTQNSTIGSSGSTLSASGSGTTYGSVTSALLTQNSPIIIRSVTYETGNILDLAFTVTGTTTENISFSVDLSGTTTTNQFDTGVTSGGNEVGGNASVGLSSSSSNHTTSIFSDSTNSYLPPSPNSSQLRIGTDSGHVTYSDLLLPGSYTFSVSSFVSGSVSSEPSDSLLTYSGSGSFSNLSLTLASGTPLSGSISAGTNSAGISGGGKGVIGGTQAQFDTVGTAGNYTANYQVLTEQELTVNRPELQVGNIDFLSAGTSIQLWDLAFDGIHSGSTTLTFNYDPTLLTGGLDQSTLYISHFDNGQWVNIGGVVDVADHTITVSTSSFSPFLLSAPESVPEPSTWVMLSGGCGLIFLLGRRRVVVAVRPSRR